MPHRAISSIAVISVFVLNNTYIVNPSTVATFRFGMNTFADDNSLPFEYDSDQLWGRSAPAFAAAIPIKKFPSTTLTGYNGTGFTGVNDRDYYSWGINGSLTKLAGAHSIKIGADYRILGVDGIQYGQPQGRTPSAASSPRSTPTTAATPATRSPTCCSGIRRRATSRRSAASTTTSSTTVALSRTTGVRPTS